MRLIWWCLKIISVFVNELVCCFVVIIKLVLVGICFEICNGLCVIMIKWLWFLFWLVRFDLIIFRLIFLLVCVELIVVLLGVLIVDFNVW